MSAIGVEIIGGSNWEKPGCLVVTALVLALSKSEFISMC